MNALNENESENENENENTYTIHTMNTIRTFTYTSAFILSFNVDKCG